VYALVGGMTQERVEESYLGLLRLLLARQHHLKIPGFSVTACVLADNYTHTISLTLNVIDELIAQQTCVVIRCTGTCEVNLPHLG
jgi:hypothetical protein